ncbi:MAG: LLM class flavin-dependent oxidoreductase [Immundisolibacterales bacterium]|nr:LLM class flavin-dependent oxidoreductase [Immundisolibacterales bacterium]
MGDGDRRRLHVGVTAWDMGLPGSADQFARQGERAESLGLDSFWLPEFHFDEGVPLPQPLLPLAAVAARTRRLRIGTGSYLLPIRHPVQVAEEVAVLDRLSEGRVILGVGRGYRAGLFDAFEVSAKDKRDRFERALDAMVAAWAGEPVGWEEEGHPVRLVPIPVQNPHPPIWIAAFGPRALEQAGRLGLPYFASPIESMEALTRNFARFREAWAVAGTAAPSEAPIMRTTFISRDRERLRAARERLAEQAASLARSPVAAIRRGAGVSPDDWALVGEPEEVRDRIEGYRERFSMTHLVASRTRLPGLDPGDFERSLEHLADLRESLDR